jgi:hypothetical protein
MKRRRIVLLAVTGALLLGLLPPASASTTHSVGTVNDDIKTCEGETIFFSGKFSSTTHYSVTPDGSFHLAYTTRLVQATAVSDSGVTYHVTGGSEGTLFGIVEGDQVVRDVIYSFREQLVLISENGNSNWLVTITAHITTTPDGKVTGVVYEGNNKCLSYSSP